MPWYFWTLLVVACVAGLAVGFVAGSSGDPDDIVEVR